MRRAAFISAATVAALVLTTLGRPISRPGPSAADPRPRKLHALKSGKARL